MERLLGVLGGMGPGATADFLAKLVARTPVEVDQDHLSVVALSVPTIPDRSQAILGAGPSPLPALRQGIARLAGLGCALAVMPCNSAHYWFDDLARDMPMLHIVDTVARALARAGVAAGPVGLLATAGTVAAGIYPARLAAAGYQVLVPTAQDQADLVGSAIRQIKAGNLAAARAPLDLAIRRLQDAGARATILGCTELPLVVAATTDPEHPVIDSTAALAAACVECLRPGAGSTAPGMTPEQWGSGRGNAWN